MRFPLPFVPKTTYKGGNGFGGSRERVRKGLKHAANDLAASPGTPVLAMQSGTVLHGPYAFFRGTYAIEIQHPDFIGRYCEIARATEVHPGDEVLEGQVIGYVGDQPGGDMLHLEFFDGTLEGNLTQYHNPPYDRRDDVFDGVQYLDDTRHTATHWGPDYQFRYRVDSQGRKFVERMDLRDI